MCNVFRARVGAGLLMVAAFAGVGCSHPKNEAETGYILAESKQTSYLRHELLDDYQSAISDANLHSASDLVGQAKSKIDSHLRACATGLAAIQPPTVMQAFHRTTQDGVRSVVDAVDRGSEAIVRQTRPDAGMAINDGRVAAAIAAMADAQSKAIESAGLSVEEYRNIADRVR